MKDMLDRLINDYQLRLNQTQELYDKTINIQLKDMIEIQLNIYSIILNDLENLNSI